MRIATLTTIHARATHRPTRRSISEGSEVTRDYRVSARSEVSAGSVVASACRSIRSLVALSLLFGSRNVAPVSTTINLRGCTLASGCYPAVMFAHVAGQLNEVAA